MKQVTNRNKKPLHQRYSELDNKVFSAFCDSFNNIKWKADYKDKDDEYCGIDVQLTARTLTKETTFDIELKSVHLDKFLDYCFLQREKWFSLVEYDNDIKLYVVIYPKHNKIAIWRVDRALLENSEKAIVEMKANTCKGNTTKEKQVYKLKLQDAKVFDFDLSNYKEKYSALHLQTA